MITSALLFAAGVALGWRYGHATILLLASGCLVAAYAAVCLIRGEFGALEVLIILAYLTALQGGFLVGQYVRRGDETR
ncbi:MAG: hypothetical protein K2Y56_02140 [Methylobacterium sp.]|uniref:hypothetical protein n=1 Tax=Methylobacterium sp. TaxID=409 RepID=UPI0025F03D9C|nr:hypothetical protein [Methylobacterium sp.]MBX9930331.1 hypothetical protein [Methylobacterium sp.]